MSNSLDPDQNVGPDLGPNLLQRLPGDENAAASRQRHVLEIQVIASLFRISISARSSDCGTTVAVMKAAREGHDNPTHPHKIVRSFTLHTHKDMKLRSLTEYLCMYVYRTT